MFHKNFSADSRYRRLPVLRWRPFVIALFAVWNGMFMGRVNVSAITPIRSILSYVPEGYSRGLPGPGKSTIYLRAVGPVEISIGDRIAPLDRNMLQLLKLEEEIDMAQSSDPVEADESSPDSILKSNVENEQGLDFDGTENEEGNESQLPEAFQPLMQEELADYQGNVEFIDPDEFLIYFEKDLPGGNGESNDRLGVPFLAPVHSKEYSPKPRSRAIFEQN